VGLQQCIFRNGSCWVYALKQKLSIQSSVYHKNISIFNATKAATAKQAYT